MATKTVYQTGIWSTPTTWASGGGADPPAAGDTVIVPNTMTLSLDGVVDTSAYTWTLQGSGAVDVDVSATGVLLKTATGLTTITANAGVVALNQLILTSNTGTVTANSGTITTNSSVVAANSGTVTTNDATGTVAANTGTVTTNQGDVTDNTGGTVTENQLTVAGGTVGTQTSAGTLAGTATVTTVFDGTFDGVQLTISGTGKITHTAGYITATGAFIWDSTATDNTGSNMIITAATMEVKKPYVMVDAGWSFITTNVKIYDGAYCDFNTASPRFTENVQVGGGGGVSSTSSYRSGSSYRA